MIASLTGTSRCVIKKLAGGWGCSFFATFNPGFRLGRGLSFARFSLPVAAQSWH